MAERTLNYKEHFCSSDAEWVVFVHGAGGSSATWFKQIKTLKQHFNLLFIDLRGHGRSRSFIDEHSNEQYSFELIVNDVCKVLDEKNISKAHFIAMSLGTIIVRHLEDMRPNQVQSMVLAGAVVRFSMIANMFAMVGHTFKNAMPYIWLYHFFALIVMPHRSQKEARSLFINEARHLQQAEFKRWFSLTRQVGQLTSRLFKQEPGCPTLYVMGDKDRFFLKSVRNSLPQNTECEVHVIPQCGHVCNIEKPDEFNQVVIDFIKKHR